MGVDIDKTRDDELAARVEGIGGVPRDGGFDGDDPASGDCNVANRIEPDRGVDDAPASDDQVVFRR
jgi:hypothetical protein